MGIASPGTSAFAGRQEAHRHDIEVVKVMIACPQTMDVASRSQEYARIGAARAQNGLTCHELNSGTIYRMVSSTNFYRMALKDHGQSPRHRHCRRHPSNRSNRRRHCKSSLAWLRGCLTLCRETAPETTNPGVNVRSESLSMTERRIKAAVRFRQIVNLSNPIHGAAFVSPRRRSPGAGQAMSPYW